MNPVRVLDLREIHPEHRHQAIVEAFRALPADESLIVVNDHYPTNLPRVLRAAFPEGHRMVFLKDGPPEWWMQIGRVTPPATGGKGAPPDE